MTKWHAQVAHMAKHMNMVGGPLCWGSLGPPKSGAVATPLQLSMWWNNTSLVQTVGQNLNCSKKSITLTGLTMFFFVSTAESRSTFKKLVLDRVSKFGWIKN